MIKTLIIIAVAAIVGLGAWQIFDYWQKLDAEKKDTQKQQAAANAPVNPDSLPGLPEGWDTSLRNAEQQGAAALGQWLKTYGAQVQDPRKAWVELDYVLMISRDNPQEAKRIFAEVRDRTPPNSPVYPRVKELEKTYQ